MNALQKIFKQISELPTDDKKQLINFLEDNLITELICKGIINHRDFVRLSKNRIDDDKK